MKLLVLLFCATFLQAQSLCIIQPDGTVDTLYTDTLLTRPGAFYSAKPWKNEITEETRFSMWYSFSDLNDSTVLRYSITEIIFEDYHTCQWIDCDTLRGISLHPRLTKQISLDSEDSYALRSRVILNPKK